MNMSEGPLSEIFIQSCWNLGSFLIMDLDHDADQKFIHCSQQNLLPQVTLRNLGALISIKPYFEIYIPTSYFTIHVCP